MQLCHCFDCRLNGRVNNGLACSCSLSVLPVTLCSELLPSDLSLAGFCCRDLRSPLQQAVHMLGCCLCIVVSPALL